MTMTDDGTGRRRGPRTDIDTRTLIIDTAERLFGDGSVDAVSLRSVAQASGVATRAVSYHFADKNELLRAVIRRRSGPIVQVTTDQLLALADSDEPVDVREVVRAVVDPYVALLSEDPVGGLRWMKVLAQVALKHNDIWRTELDAEPGLAALFRAATRRALPTVPAAEARAGMAMMSAIMTLANSDLPAYGSPLGPKGLDRAWLTQLVEFTAAGLRGATGSAPKRISAAAEDRDIEASGRGRPRDRQRRAAVVSATRELLGEKGYEELTLTEVARRAGVSRPFVYDHWGSRFALVEDAIFAVPDQDSLIDEGKPFERALTDLIEAMVRIQSDPIYLAGLSGIASELYNRAELLAQVEAKYTAPIRATYVRLVERGKAEGIVRPDVDGSALLDTVRGAVMMHMLIAPPAEAALVEHLRSIIVPGITRRD